MIKNNNVDITADIGGGLTPLYTLPLLGEPAPPFKADSTEGFINFPADYKGKWVLLFSYPGDFCSVCTTEIIGLANNKELYDELGVELVGVSIDSLLSHFGWIENIEALDLGDGKKVKVDFPLVEDDTMEISRRYGLLRRGEIDTSTVRGGFLIDPEGKIRAIQIYPLETGRFGDEIRRVVEAVIKSREENVYTPANWQPGDDVILPEPTTVEEMMKNLQLAKLSDDYYCLDWNLCFKKDKVATEPFEQPENDKNNSSNNNHKNNNSNMQIKRTSKPFVNKFR
jgi:peroxiredoxin (alkyl hydroperoxide reductase subunit C)